MPEIQNVCKEISENRELMRHLLPIQESFDLIQRDIRIGGRDASFYFLDGMLKDETMLKIMDSLLKIQESDMPSDATCFSQNCIPYVEVDIYGDYDQIIRNILSGVLVLFIDGYEAGIAIDCRTYPMRSVEEPEKDKSLRGSKDGFVETVVFDTALIRRRIRDPGLVMEMLEVGTSSRSDVVLCYMKDLVDPNLLSNLRK